MAIKEYANNDYAATQSRDIMKNSVVFQCSTTTFSLDH